MPAPSTSPITNTVSIGRVIAGRSGVAVSRPVPPALVVAVLISCAYPGMPHGMTHSPSGRPTSVWMDTAPHTTYPALAESLRVDVCVVGGGMLGLMTADLLKRAGRTVAVLEADRIATGVTGYTTAKVTALHGLIYDQVRSDFGDEGARHYAEANAAGLELIAERAAAIPCDFRRRSAYTYAEDHGDVEKLRKEVDAARAAGLPAELVDDV